MFAIILIISGIAAWWMGGYSNYDKGSFHTFISILMGLGIFVTFMFYYNIVQVQNAQQEFAAIQEASRISDSILNNILDEIRIAGRIIPNFVTSITPLTSKICCGETCSVEKDEIRAETCTERMVLSYRIFSLWQDVIETTRYANIDLLACVSNFLQRANSNQLYEEWLVNRLNFGNRTQRFGDILFTYGLQITIQTPEEYTSVANKVLSDPNFNGIMC